MTALVLLCRIAGRRVAIPTDRVVSVIEIEAITPVPGAPAFVLGLTALRSQALTVIDCRVSLGHPPSERPVGNRAAVIEHDGHRYALVVDEALDVAEALSAPVAVAGGFGECWRDAAIGMIETDSDPALAIAVEQLIEGPRAAAAA